MGVVGLKCVSVIVAVQKRLKTTGLVLQQAMDNKDKNSHSGPYARQPQREKVHIWLGSLHAADFIYCLCDDSLFDRLSKNLACERVGKSEDHFIFFGGSFTNNG